MPTASAYQSPSPQLAKPKKPRPSLYAGITSPALRNIQGVNLATQRSLGAAPPTQPPSILGTLTNRIGPPQGPTDQTYWGAASHGLQQQLSAQAQAAASQRAAGNEQLRLASVLKGGNRFPSTQMRGRYMGAMGIGNAPPESSAPAGLDLGQQRELLDAVKYRDQQRAAARGRIEAGGGLPQAPRTGMGGLIDRVLPRKTYDVAGDPRPAFAQQVADMQAQQTKRSQFLAGQGPYQGAGPTNRKADVQMGRLATTMHAQGDRGARQWRLAGGPQQQMLNNYMAANNPALALGMYRTNMEAQQAGLDRDLQREELAIRRDVAKHGMTEATQSRLDALQGRKEEMAQRQTEFSGQQGLAQEGLGFQKQQGQAELAQRDQQFKLSLQQGQERIEELKRQGKAADAEREQSRLNLFSATYNAVADANPRWQPEQIQAEVSRRMGLAQGGTAAPATGQPTEAGQAPPPTRSIGRVPEGRLQDLYEAGKFEELNREAIRAGYDQPGQPTTDSLYQYLSGKKSGSKRLPKGATMWSALKPWGSYQDYRAWRLGE